MSHVVSLIVLLCLNASLFTPTFAFDLEEGDLCDLGSNVTGVCHNISKCGYGIKLLSRGIRPKLCGFEGLHAIVCCTPSEEETIRIKELQNKDTDILTDTLAATQLSQSSPVPMSDNNNNKKKDTSTHNLTLTEIPESTSTLVYEVPVFFPISVISDQDRNKDAVTQNLTRTEIPQISPITNDNKNTTNPNITETTTKFTSILDGYIPYSSEQKCEEWYPLIFYIDILQPAGGGGGEPALKDEFKHMAAVGYGAANDIQWSCGGSLISNKFVLTAAHCLVSNHGNASWVRLGDIDISGKSNTTAIIDVPVKALYGHPDYKYPERHHDIALLELEREVEFTDNIKPACLDYFGDLSENNLTATGWGLTSFLGESSNLLLKVDLDKVPFEECQKEFQYIDNEIQLCAGGGFKKDTCQGDSGGPLQIRRKQHPTNGPIFHMIMAITSYGGPCGLSKKPGVYTRVFPHLEWIENIVWPKDR